ncbi:hypothetical protein [Cryobacterium adonitolivorans]|uniref:hypothetical protein n=1 Tax=Cryobacterium adonitolivorans TaxID=1259189 RepID=UPI0018E076B8|nr:hypothetical protein [Cryobacterium adonitolivorans]
MTGHDDNHETAPDIIDDAVAPAIQYADQANESIRDLTHATMLPAQLPAPLVYEVLGNLKGVGSRLPQALQQLAKGLGRSIDQYDVYEDDASDPVQSIATATDHLTRAAQLADQLGDELAKAQAAISRQGYRTRTE